MRCLPGLLAGLAGITTTLAIAGPASASSCAATVSLQWPTEGATVPQGALLMVDEFCLFGESSGLSASVGDEEISIVEGPYQGAYRFEPEPELGSLVTIRWFMRPETEDDPFVRRIRIGPRDASPAPLTAPSLELAYEHRESWIDETTYWGLRVKITGSPDNAGRPVFYTLTGSGEIDTSLPTTDGTESAGGHWAEELLPAAGEEVCVTVQAFDVYGGQSGPVTACTEALADPRGSEADAGDTDGGDGTADAGEGEGDSAGAGCSMGRPRAAWEAALLVPLIGWAHRRRSPRRT